MTPENSNPIKSFKWNDHEIEVDEMTKAADIEYQVIDTEKKH